jgi:sortase A
MPAPYTQFRDERHSCTDAQPGQGGAPVHRLGDDRERSPADRRRRNHARLAGAGVGVLRPRVFYKRPLPGDAIGEIDMPAIDKSAYIVEGTDTDDLRKGPGHYHDTPMPGDHGTVAIAGHRTTHGAPFRNIDKLKRGDRIILELPYGRFVYRVEKTQIVEPTALWVTDRVGYDRLVLSACHPLYSAAQRLIVFARFVRRGNSTVERS